VSSRGKGDGEAKGSDRQGKVSGGCSGAEAQRWREVESGGAVMLWNRTSNRGRA
jgi:hypothetical protein